MLPRLVAAAAAALFVGAPDPLQPHLCLAALLLVLVISLPQGDPNCDLCQVGPPRLAHQVRPSRF